MCYVCNVYLSRRHPSHSAPSSSRSRAYTPSTIWHHPSEVLCIYFRILISRETHWLVVIVGWWRIWARINAGNFSLPTSGAPNVIDENAHIRRGRRRHERANVASNILGTHFRCLSARLHYHVRHFSHTQTTTCRARGGTHFEMYIRMYLYIQ